MRFDLRYKDADNHFKNKVCWAPTFGSMRKFLAQIKTIVKLSETQQAGLTPLVGICRPPYAFQDN